MQGWVTLTWLLLLLQVLTCHGLGGYPGTFYQIMLRLNKERKNARTAPSPNRLWVILDPAASLGSLSREPLNSNRIIRSASFRIPDLEEVQEEWNPGKVFPQEPLTDTEPREEEWNPMAGLHGEELATETVITEEWNTSTTSPQEDPVTEAALTEQQQQQEEEEVTQTAVLVEGATQTDPEMDQWTTEVSTRDANREPAESCGGEVWMKSIPGNNTTLEEGSKHQQVLVTPGWYDGHYPHNLDCVWNLNVGTECQAGLLLYKVLEGQVRETNRCLQDYLQVLQPNGFSARYCGPLVNKGKAVSGTDAWSKAEPRTTTLRFKSSHRTDQSSTDLLANSNLPRGFRMEVTYYCWMRNKDLLQRGTTRGTGTTGEDSGTTGEDAGTTREDAGTTISYADTFGNTVDDSGSADRNDGTSNTIGTDTGTIVDDSGTTRRDASTSGTPVSDTGTTGNDVGTHGGTSGIADITRRKRWHQ